MRIVPNSSNYVPYDNTFIGSVHTFNLTVDLTDTASGQSGSFIFHGGVDGFVNKVISSPGGDAGPHLLSTTDLNLRFSSPTTQSMVLGNHLYKVTIDWFTFSTSSPWPPPPGSSGIPSDAAAYREVPMRVQVSDVPEPSTMALAAVGLAGLGLRAWRRCRARRAP
jgi:hypothetical protein